jgi:hypothetical protein
LKSVAFEWGNQLRAQKTEGHDVTAPASARAKKSSGTRSVPPFDSVLGIVERTVAGRLPLLALAG